MAPALRYEEIGNKVVLVTFDLPDKKVNTLGTAVLKELGELVGRLEGRGELRGLLFRGGKPDQFVAGADLNELGALSQMPRDAIGQGIDAGHALFNRVSKLPFPTVALIDGPCMGGGTELVLAMDERIVADTPAVKVALPEVKVGLIPAWGGTQRLPRLVGVSAAVEMIGTGDTIDAKKAVAIGFAFDAVPTDRMVEEGLRRIDDLQATGDWFERRRKRSGPVGLGPDAAAFLFGTAEGFIRAKTKGHYPAPLAALKAVRDGVNLTLEKGLAAEREAALDVVGSTTAANLIAVFFMNNRLSRDPGVSDPSVVPREVRRVGVLGAGLMGSGIATAFARSGVPTVMADVDQGRIDAGLARAKEVVTSRIKIGRATTDDLAAMLGRLGTGTSPDAFSGCDLVVEAIVENEKAKLDAFKTLGAILPEGATLASNTSTISITRMAGASPDPSRFVGVHFFNPVDRMELVEVIRGEATSDETVATVVALAKKIRKTPIVVRDCAGFLVNRVLYPYLSESLRLLTEGAPMDAIDRAATDFGMPMGPITLQDFVGLDTLCYSGRVMAEAYPDRARPAPLLEEMVAAGRMGKKSGAGYRKFDGKGKPHADPDFEAMLARHRTGDHVPDAAEITDRLFLAMFLEATRVLQEGIVRDPADADMGMILGTGFPPFRGGPLRWADSEGPGTLLERLEPYAHLGPRFEPTDLLRRLAAGGGRFYPRPNVAAVPGR